MVLVIRVITVINEGVDKFLCLIDDFVEDLKRIPDEFEKRRNEY